MANAPETVKFFESGGTIYTDKKASTLANFVKMAGLAVAVAVVIPSVTDNTTPDKIETADIAVVEEINKIVAFKAVTGSPRFDDAKVTFPMSAAAEKTTQTINVSAVEMMDAVARLRLDGMNATSVYHQYGGYKIPHNILKDLVRAAKDADFPADYLFGIVEKESGFDCNAKPPSGSARGCMQVIDQTWLRLVKEHGAKFGLTEEAGLVELTYNKRKQPVYEVADKEQAKNILDLRYNVYFAAALAVTDLKSAKSRIERNLSARFTDADLYLPHFMGEDRAEAALAAYKKRPDASASKIFNREAKANPGMFYDGKGRRRVPIDVASFIKRAQNVILSRSAKYQNVEVVAQKNSLDFISANDIPVPVAKPNLNNDTFIAAMKSRISSRKIVPSETGIVRLSDHFETDLQRGYNFVPKL